MEDRDIFVLTTNEKGEPCMKRPSDFVEMTKEDAEIIEDFIKQNQELFNKFVRMRKPKCHTLQKRDK